MDNRLLWKKHIQTANLKISKGILLARKTTEKYVQCLLSSLT